MPFPFTESYRTRNRPPLFLRFPAQPQFPPYAPSIPAAEKSPTMCFVGFDDFHHAGRIWLLCRIFTKAAGTGNRGGPHPCFVGWSIPVKPTPPSGLYFAPVCR